MHLYHCSHDDSLASQPLKPFDGKASWIRGLCFSQGCEDQFGDHTYRTTIKGDLLSDNLIWNLELAGDEGVERKGREGMPIHLTMDQLKEACKEAMAEMGMDLDEATIRFVFERAIESDECDECIRDEYGELKRWDETVDLWDLQSVRALVAHKVGLEGATITDETGAAYIIANPDLALTKVEWDEDQADFVAVAGQEDSAKIDAASTMPVVRRQTQSKVSQTM